MGRSNVLCAIAFNWHDSSVSFADGRKILLVLEAERFFRVKKMACTAAEMETLVTFGANVLGLEVDEIDHWALASLNNPWLSPRHGRALVERDWFWDEVTFLGRARRCLVVGHHYAHAASAYFVSGRESAIVQTCDGGGDFHECVVAFKGSGLDLERISQCNREAVTGLPYSLMSGFFYRERFCEGKMMALAAMGEPGGDHATIIDDLMPVLNTAGADIQRGDRPEDIDRNFMAGMERVNTLLERHIGGLFRGPGEFAPESLDFIATFQERFSRHRTADIARLAREHGASPIALAGGVCLNLAANTAIHDGVSSDLFIPPNCDDSGQSFGALCKLVAVVEGARPEGGLPFVGMGGDEVRLDQVDAVADLLARGETVFLHNGKAETGPRALGHRSMLARADSETKKSELSVMIKQREAYRPVAPITTVEAASDWFDGPKDSPFMLHTYRSKSMFREKLCGVTHMDGTARVQTVTRDSDPFMHALLELFGELTGAPILINTSLNLKGEPISNGIEDTMKMAADCRARALRVNIVHDGALVADR